MYQLDIGKIKNICITNKDLLTGIVGSFVVKIGAVLVAFFTTPAYMRFFTNQAVLGIWFTLVSVFNMFLQFDLGLGNGLRNRLTESLAQNDKELSKKYVSSAYVSIIIFTLFLWLFIVCLLGLIPLNEILNISQAVIPSWALKRGVFICLIGLCGQCVFRLVTSVFYALQKAAVPSFLLLISNFIILLVAWAAPNEGNISDNFLLLSTAYAFLSNVPLIVATIWVFLNEMVFCVPSIRCFDLKIAKDLLGLGLTFFYLQALGSIMISCNEFLITIFLSPEKAVDYQVYYKIFSLPYTVYSLFIASFWSAITKAKTEKKYGWLKNTYKVICIIILLLSVSAFLLVIFVPYVVKIWLREQARQVEIYTEYCLWFAAWCAANMWLRGNCVFANGLEWMKTQKILMPFGCIINMIGAILLMKTSKAWISVIQINVFISLIMGIIQSLVITRKLYYISEEKTL